jgi:hypothetical protein
MWWTFASVLLGLWAGLFCSVSGTELFDHDVHLNPLEVPMSSETLSAMFLNVVLGLPFFMVGLLVAPAFGYISEQVVAAGSVTLRVVLNGADAVAPRPIRRRTLTRQASSLEDKDRVFVAIVIVVAVVGLYLKYRAPILLGLSIVALIIAIAATVSIVSMSRKRILTGSHSTTFVLVMLYFAFAVGIVDVALLWNPPAGGELFREYISGESSDKFLGFMFVAYQVVGAVSYLLVAVLSIGFCIAIMTAINLHTNTWGRWLWKLLFRYTSITWSGWAFGLALFLAALSILCAGGWLFRLLQQLQTVNLPI